MPTTTSVHPFSRIWNGGTVIPVTVVIETSYLVEHRLGPDAEARFLTELLGEDYRVEQLTAGDLRRMAELVHRYADMPLGAVDAFRRGRDRRAPRSE